MDFAIAEERIKQSMLILDNDFQEITATKDQRMQGGILARMVTRQREVDAILAEQSKLLTDLLKTPKAMNDADRAARLLLAFEFATKFAHFVKDEMGDVKFYNQLITKKNKIVEALDAIEPGRRSVLAPFLDNTDAGVRCSAAIYLMRIMPDRALPVLRAVEESESGMSAGFAAFWEIARYETEAKAADLGSVK